MPTAKKLPSGSWRCRVFSHYEVKDGKKTRVYESFTSKDPSPHGKREAEQMASEWAYKRTRRVSAVTIADAIESYISSKDGVLSPSTVRAYKSYQKTHFDEIGAMSIRNLDMIGLQRWVSSMDLSPKSVSNIYGLLNSALKVYTGSDLNLTLPAPKKPDLHTPTDPEIRQLMNHIKGRDLEVAVALAAFCSLRRGEICALRAEDLNGDVLTVKRSMVKTPDGFWDIKQPKTKNSYRSVLVPQLVVDYFAGKKGDVFSFNPDNLSNRFRRAIRYSHVPNSFRFHDLRHYYASIAHALGVPDAYIMKTGGWKSEHVMKRVYREALDDKMRSESEKMISHMAEMVNS